MLKRKGMQMNCVEIKIVFNWVVKTCTKLMYDLIFIIFLYLLYIYVTITQIVAW